MVSGEESERAGAGTARGKGGRRRGKEGSSGSGSGGSGDGGSYSSGSYSDGGSDNSFDGGYRDTTSSHLMSSTVGRVGRDMGVSLSFPSHAHASVKVHSGNLRTRRQDEGVDREETAARQYRAKEQMAQPRCNLCGAVPPDDPEAEECDVCGADLMDPAESVLEKAVMNARVRADQEPQPPLGQPRAPSPPRQAFRCPYCAVSLDPTARYCYDCNTPLPPVAVLEASASRPASSSQTSRPKSPGKAAGHGKVQCRECGVTLKVVPGDTQCAVCDADLPTSFVVPPPAAAAASTSSASAGTHHDHHHSHHRGSPAAAAGSGGGGGGGGSKACTNCEKQCEWDARWCSWCGFKFPLPVQRVIICQHCSTENLNGARYCNDCGSALPAPQDDRITTGGGNQMSMQSFAVTSDGTVQRTEPGTTVVAAPGGAGDGSGSGGASGGATAPRRGRVKTATVGIQTGLYFPSAKAMQQKQAKAELGRGGNSALPAMPTSAAGVSPGEGFWRAQIAFMAEQLKAYARDTPAFQEAAGRPVMGEVAAAQIREVGDEVELTVLFANRGSSSKSRKAETVVYADSKDQAGLARLSGPPTEVRAYDNGDPKHAQDAKLPPHAVLLKVGAPVTITKSLSLPDGTKVMSGTLAYIDSCPLLHGTPAVAAVAHDDAGCRLHVRLDGAGHKRKLVKLQPIEAALFKTGGKSKLFSRWYFPVQLAFSVAASASTSTSKGKKVGGRGAGSKKGALNAATLALIETLGPSGDGDDKTVLGLLDTGADPDANPPNRMRPLYLAALHGRVQAVKFLLDSNADVNSKAVHGDTPLHAAVRCRGHEAEECARALLAAGAKQDVKNIKGVTPAGLAAELGRESIRKLLAKSLAGGTLAKMTGRK